MDTLTNTAQEGAIKPKTHYSGKITKTMLAGAIVDIGQNVPGVVHISQLRAEPVNRVEDVPFRIEQLLGSKKLKEMAGAAKALGRPDAAAVVCRSVANRMKR